MQCSKRIISKLDQHFTIPCIRILVTNKQNCDFGA